MKKNELFLLGTGFSKFIDRKMPLLNDLTTVIEEKIKNNGEKIYQDIYDDLISKWIHEHNFEQILTFLYQDFPWKSSEESNLSKSLYFYITKLIDKIIKEIQRGISKDDLIKRIELKKFMNYLHVSEASIITFNYDTILEDLGLIFLKAKQHEIKGSFPETSIKTIRCIKDWNNANTTRELPFKINRISEEIIDVYFNHYDVSNDEWSKAVQSFSSDNKDMDIERRLTELFKLFESNFLNSKLSYLDFYPFAINPIMRRTFSIWNRKRIKTFETFKLHGSINWYYSGSFSSASEQLYLSSPFGEKDETEINLKDLVPLIIPPVLDKTFYYKHNTLRTMWNEAKNIISRAEKIHIIGYSLPETDLTVKYMLQKYLSKKCKIIVVDKNKKIEQKIKDFFPKNEIIFYVEDDVAIVDKYIQEEIKNFE